MALHVDGMTVHRIGEALARAGLSRATYFRWVKQGRIADVRYRDRNGRRVFTTEELKALEKAANQLIDASPQVMIPFEDRE